MSSAKRRKEKVELQLIQALKKWGLHNLARLAVPVDIEHIAKALGVINVRRVDIPAAGMLVPSENGYEILLNSAHSNVRQRFSCAHEIAHALLNPVNPDYSPAMRSQPISSNAHVERTCEAMAAHLLMPEPSFSDDANKKEAGIDRIVGLADSYEVSIQAAALRFMEVVEEDCVLLLSQLRPTASGDKLCLKWPPRNSLSSGKPIVRYFQKGEQLRSRTAYLAQSGDQIVSGTEIVKLGSTVLTSYVESKAFGFGYGRYVMTIAFPKRQI